MTFKVTAVIQMVLAHAGAVVGGTGGGELVVVVVLGEQCQIGHAIS